MGLVVPLLRLAMVFLNVYDSFKTLKPPPASSRKSGRSSLRGKTQRKRDMKGCLAVWIVWCCFMSYERFFERVISLFIPFYDEMKSLALLFLIFTRARGAEPIYLHVIRPMLKPYSATLDLCLDATCMIGDMIYTLSMMPIHHGFSWWRHYFGSGTRHDELQSEDSSPAQTPPLGDLAPSSVSNGGPTRTIRLPVSRQQSRSHMVTSSSEAKPSRRYPASEITRPGFPPLRARTTGAAQAAKASSSKPPNPRSASQPLDRQSPSRRQPRGSFSEPHVEVWTPPASYRDSDDEDAASAPSQSAAMPQASICMISGLPIDAHEQIEEWRKYPALPAAYPPTPLVATVPLKSRHDRLETAVPPIIEESSTYDAADGPVLSAEPSVELDDEMDSDVDDSEPEDAFNLSLRTPQARRTARATGVYNGDDQIVSSASSSSSSLHTRSTTLDTIDNASSLRTGATSDSEALSDSSLPGHRRVRSRNGLETKKGKASESAPLKVPNGRATIRAKSNHQSSARMISMSQQQIIRSMGISTASDDEIDAPSAPSTEALDTAFKSKRRKVVSAKNPSVVTGTRTMRSATKASALDKNKALGPPQKAKSTAGTRASKQPGAPPNLSVQSTTGASETDGSQPGSQRTVRKR